MAKRNSGLGGGLTPANDGAVSVRSLQCVYTPQNNLQRALQAAWVSSRFIVLTGGPGTGKTGGAVGQALIDLINERVRKIILTRPPVSQGPGIGFLTGTLEEKMAPWLGSVQDAMEGFSDATLAKLGRYIEIADLGMIQGRTVRDAILIVDEASNVYDRAMMLCLATRVGRNGKVVLCGDPMQTNIGTRPNPFADFAADHANVPGVSVLTATPADVIRSDFVSAIMDNEERVQAKKRRK